MCKLTKSTLPLSPTPSVSHLNLFLFPRVSNLHFCSLGAQPVPFPSYLNPPPVLLTLILNAANRHPSFPSPVPQPKWRPPHPDLLVACLFALNAHLSGSSCGYGTSLLQRWPGSLFRFQTMMSSAVQVPHSPALAFLPGPSPASRMSLPTQHLQPGAQLPFPPPPARPFKALPQEKLSQLSSSQRLSPGAERLWN